MSRAAMLALLAGLALPVPGRAQFADPESPMLGDPLSSGPRSRGAAELAIGDQESLPPDITMGIERELAAHGYAPGPIDGLITLETRDAIRAFQSAAGLRPTGEPSEDLLERLRMTALVPGGTGGEGAASQRQIEIWARDLIGKPVHGQQTGAIGEIEDLIVGPDRTVNAVVVAVRGEGGAAVARVPVPWQWVGQQVGNPSIILPWSEAEVAWMVAGAGADGEGAASAGLAGRKASWLDGAPAELAAGGAFGTVEGFLFAPSGQVAAILVRRSQGRAVYEIPREHVTVQETPRRLVIHMPLPRILALAPRDTPPETAQATE